MSSLEHGETLPAADVDCWEVSGTRTRSETAEIRSALTTSSTPLEPLAVLNFAGDLLGLVVNDDDETVQISLSAVLCVTSGRRTFGVWLMLAIPSAIALCTSAPSSVVPGGNDAVCVGSAEEVPVGNDAI